MRQSSFQSTVDIRTDHIPEAWLSIFVLHSKNVCPSFLCVGWRVYWYSCVHSHVSVEHFAETGVSWGVWDGRACADCFLSCNMIGRHSACLFRCKSCISITFLFILRVFETALHCC